MKFLTAYALERCIVYTIVHDNMTSQHAMFVALKRLAEARVGDIDEVSFDKRFAGTIDGAYVEYEKKSDRAGELSVCVFSGEEPEKEKKVLEKILEAFETTLLDLLERLPNQPG